MRPTPQSNGPAIPGPVNGSDPESSPRTSWDFTSPPDRTSPSSSGGGLSVSDGDGDGSGSVGVGVGSGWVVQITFMVKPPENTPVFWLSTLPRKRVTLMVSPSVSSRRPGHSSRSTLDVGKRHRGCTGREGEVVVCVNRRVVVGHRLDQTGLTDESRGNGEGTEIVCRSDRCSNVTFGNVERECFRGLGQSGSRKKQHNERRQADESAHSLTSCRHVSRPCRPNISQVR